MESRRISVWLCKQKVQTKNKDETESIVYNHSVHQGKKLRSVSFTNEMGVMLERNLGSFCFTI